MERVIKVGIIGFGMAGRVFHAPVINSLLQLQLSKIVTGNEKTAEYIRLQYPQCQVVRETEAVLNDEEIELVVVATPNTSHKELAAKALKAGKHVVVEKPFTITSQEADELIELAGKQQRILSVHQNRRWDSDFLTVKSIIEGQLLGRLVEYEAHYDRFRNRLKENAWREENQPGAGILYDLGSHLIDQALVLFGTPQEIYADIRVQRPVAKVDDHFEIILYYPQLKVTLKSGSLVREPLPHFILLGEQGSFVKYGMDVQEAALKKGLTPKDLEDWGREPEDQWGILNTNVNGVHFRGRVESIPGDYSAYYQNVCWAIMKEEALLVKPQESRNVIRVIELALESNHKKCRIQYR